MYNALPELIRAVGDIESTLYWARLSSKFGAHPHNSNMNILFKFTHHMQSFCYI